MKAITIDDAKYSCANFLSTQPPNWYSSNIYTVNSKNEQYELFLLLVEDALTNFNYCLILSTNKGLLDVLAILINNNFGEKTIYGKKVLINQLTGNINDSIRIIFYSESNLDLIGKLLTNQTNINKIQKYPLILVMHPAINEEKFRDLETKNSIFDFSFTGIRIIWDILPKNFFNNKEILEIKKSLPTNQRFIAGLKPISPSRLYIDFYKSFNNYKNTNSVNKKTFNDIERQLLDFGPAKLKKELKLLIKTSSKYFYQDIKLEELKHTLSFIEPKDERRILLFTPSHKISAYLLHSLRKSSLKIRGNFIAGVKFGSTKKMTIKQEKNFWSSFDAEEFDLALLNRCIPIKEFNLSRLTDIIFYGATIEPIIKALYEKDTLDFFDTKIHLFFIKDTYEEKNLWRILRT